MSEDQENTKPTWVHALTLGSETTPAQRQRNFALHQRLKEGDPADDRAHGLSHFIFDVPIGRMSMSPRGDTFSFRLDKSDECFSRLLHVIADHFDTRCDADDEVARLRALLAEHGIEDRRP